MARNFKGAKLEETKDIYDAVQLAKLFRADVKAAKKAGELPKELKLGVRTSTYSMGQSIRVEIKAVGPSVRLYNPERFLREKEAPEERIDYHHYPVLTEQADLLQEQIQGMLNAYNYDKSDSQSDYFDVKFYAFVEYSGSLIEADKETITEEEAKAYSEAKWEKEEKEMAEYRAKKEIEDKENEERRAKEKIEHEAKEATVHMPKEGVGIRFNWSESNNVDCSRIFTTFAEANTHLNEAEAKELAYLTEKGIEWGGYRKTNFTIVIDGEEYTGRYDIGCDDPTIEEHVLSFCDPKSNPFLKASTTEEKQEMVQWSIKLLQALIAEKEAEPDIMVVSVPEIYIPVAKMPEGLN